MFVHNKKPKVHIFGIIITISLLVYGGFILLSPFRNVSNAIVKKNIAINVQANERTVPSSHAITNVNDAQYTTKNQITHSQYMSPDTPRISIWETSHDGTSKLLAKQTNATFTLHTKVADATVTLNENKKYQQIDGVGASFTDTSAWLVSQLPAKQRLLLMTELFDPIKGAGLSYLRQPFGSSDFALRIYPGDDLDPALYDQKYIIPLLKQAIQINPRVKIMATPWSAPAWMKSNYAINIMDNCVSLPMLMSLTGSKYGGTINPCAYHAYAVYLVHYIQAYESEGIPIDAITVQNEPGNSANYPSMLMTPREEANFIGNYLGPEFNKAGLLGKTKIIAYDWNWGIPKDDHYEYPLGTNSFYPLSVLQNLSAKQKAYLNGFSFHCYSWSHDKKISGVVQSQSYLHNMTGKDIYFTECSGTVSNQEKTDETKDQAHAVSDSINADLDWSIENLVIGTFSNWSRTTETWNMALNTLGGPTNTGGGCDTNPCRGVVTIDPKLPNGFLFNVEYYVLGQVGKVVEPGAFRIDSQNEGNSNIEEVAFLNPDSSKALIILNTNTSSALKVKINWNKNSMIYSIDPGAVVSFKWK